MQGSLIEWMCQYIPCHYFDNKAFANSDFLSSWKNYRLICDFGWLFEKVGEVPPLPKSFPQSYTNIHPVLLTNYGGKDAVCTHVSRGEASWRFSYRISMEHLVNENYDEGNMVFQAQVALDASDTPESIAQKVHVLEYEHFPKVIENYISKYGEENQVLWFGWVENQDL